MKYNETFMSKFQKYQIHSVEEYYTAIQNGTHYITFRDLGTADNPFELFLPRLPTSEEISIRFMSSYVNICSMSATVLHNFNVESLGNNHIRVIGAKITAGHNDTIEACLNSKIKDAIGCSIRAFNNARIGAGIGTTVNAYDDSFVRVWENATVYAQDRTVVNATEVGGVTIYARDNSYVNYEGNDRAMVFKQSSKAVVSPSFERVEKTE